MDIQLGVMEFVILGIVVLIVVFVHAYVQARNSHG